MTWLFVLMIAFLIFGLRRGPVLGRHYGWMLLVVVCVVAYMSVNLKTL